MFGQVKKSDLQKSITSLIASGSTCLTAAIETATDMFTSVIEERDTTNRIIFLTDLCSTVDSVNDEKKLLTTIKTNAERGIFTSVVGIGMVCFACHLYKNMTVSIIIMYTYSYVKCKDTV